MVVLHFKKQEGNEFLYETNTSIPVAQLIEELCKMHNLRFKVDKAAQSMEELASKGPLRPEELRGLQDLDDFVKNEDLTVIQGLAKMPPKTGVREVKDENHYRTGWVVSEEMAKQMLDAAMEAKQLIHVSQVARKNFMKFDELNNMLDTMKGLLMMAYPGYHGLGEWEPIRVLLEDQEEWDEATESVDGYLSPDKVNLWICSKELIAGKTFSHYFGKNEKSKFVCKLASVGTGVPSKEPLVDPNTQKAMMSYYYKKQEEHKQLDEQNEDDYLNSVWADNKALKASMHGNGGDIKWKSGIR